MKTTQGTPVILDENRPWAFRRAELTAGLRRFTGDNSLTIAAIEERNIPYRRPSRGRLRGIRVKCSGLSKWDDFNLVVKEPLGVTRAGTAHAGWREVSFYFTLADQLPFNVPQLVAAHPEGRWLALMLLPGSLDPLKWATTEYMRAIDQLVNLHDRFWNLGEDLTTYSWLARPLDADFEVHVKAAAIGIQRLVEETPMNQLNQELDLIQRLGSLVINADRIAAFLRKTPLTLLHGDYWPGNISIYADGSFYVLDWQRAAIGPGVLDILNFVQSSLWWFHPLPVSPQDMITRYRDGIASTCGWTWSDTEWEMLWDCSLLWTFLSDWVDLLARIPNSILETRIDQLKEIWLEPVSNAVLRQFGNP